jgi:hypothetical protein
MQVLRTSAAAAHVANTQVAQLKAGSVVFGPGELRPYVEQILEILASMLHKMLPGFARAFVSAGTIKRLLIEAMDRVWPKGEPVALGTNELTARVDTNRLDI